MFPGGRHSVETSRLDEAALAAARTTASAAAYLAVHQGIHPSLLMQGDMMAAQQAAMLEANQHMSMLAAGLGGPSPLAVVTKLRHALHTQGEWERRPRSAVHEGRQGTEKGNSHASPLGAAEPATLADAIASGLKWLTVHDASAPEAPLITQMINQASDALKASTGIGAGATQAAQAWTGYSQGTAPAPQLPTMGGVWQPQQQSPQLGQHWLTASPAAPSSAMAMGVLPGLQAMSLGGGGGRGSSGYGPSGANPWMSDVSQRMAQGACWERRPHGWAISRRWASHRILPLPQSPLPPCTTRRPWSTPNGSTRPRCPPSGRAWRSSSSRRQCRGWWDPRPRARWRRPQGPTGPIAPRWSFPNRSPAAPAAAPPPTSPTAAAATPPSSSRRQRRPTAPRVPAGEPCRAAAIRLA